MVPYAEILAFVQQIAPTWCKTQHVNFAQLIFALLERENLALSDLARAWPAPDQPLHGRLKRLERFLNNPRLDETALSVRYLKLSYHFGATLPKRLRSVRWSRFSSTRSTSSHLPCWSALSPVAVGVCRSP